MTRAAVPAVSAILLVLAAAGCGTRGAPPGQVRSPGAYGIDFVENEVCAECHEKEFEEWRGSHHDLAMQVAAPETVRGDFNGVEFAHFGVTSKFFRSDGNFIVNTEGPDGKLADFTVKYTFGYEPLQQYLIEFPDGSLQCLGIAWDTERKRWFHLYPDERIEPGDYLHWTGWSQRWNLMCAECHSTNLRKNFDPESQTYRTAWDEINVSCQACHGPGADHVRWARTWPEGETPAPGETQLVADFAVGDSRYQVEQCARCHSRRSLVSEDDRHGRPFLDDFLVSTLREGLYHADGQILDEVYVYGSFVQSQMYRRGVRCTDCHNPHTLQRKAEGNALCVECHQTAPPERFPTLQRKDYDTPDHHHHPVGSDGASCAKCHMPERTYMVVDPRSDHSFRIPRPDLSVKLGTPNTCNDCHSGKPAEWAASAVADWYGPAATEPHFAPAFAAARSGDPAAGADLARLAGDPNQPSIVRATALEMLRAHGTGGQTVMAGNLDDSDPLVRATAAAGLDRLPPAEKIEALASLLSDPIRAVRAEAVRGLASGREFLTSERGQAFDAAMAEYRAAQLANADTPGARLNLGIVESAMGDTESAEASYAGAIRLDPAFLPAQLNLASLYNQLGRNEEAERVLRDAIAQSPGNGELRYSLGLLLAEQERLAEASQSLEQAAQLMPSRARVRYNYALSLQHLGRLAGAERELLEANRADPLDPAIVNALVIFYLQQQRLQEAHAYALKLLELSPGSPGPRQLLSQIESQLQSQ